MTNKKSLVMMLAFAFLAVGNLAAQTDSRLNGTWAGVWQETELEYRFSNGNYEESADGVPSERGTYTTYNGEIRWNPTHYFGSAINSLFFDPIFDLLDIPRVLRLGLFEFESRWYSKNEFIIAYRSFLLALLLASGVPDDGTLDEIIYPIVSPSPATYSVDANSLILTSTVYDQKVVIILTKRR